LSFSVNLPVGTGPKNIKIFENFLYTDGSVNNSLNRIDLNTQTYDFNIILPGN
jgi:hypothetical protein